MISEVNDTPSCNSDDLFHALKESLERRGVLDPLRAILRGQAFESLEMASKAEEQVDYINPTDARKCDWPLEMKISEAVFVNYLKFHRLDQTLSVFTAEINKRKGGTLTECDVENELGLSNLPCRACSRPYGKAAIKDPLIYRVIEKIRTYEKGL